MACTHVNWLGTSPFQHACDEIGLDTLSTIAVITDVVTIAATLDKKAAAAAVLPQLLTFFRTQLSTSASAELKDWTATQIEPLGAALRAMTAVDCHPPRLQPQDRHPLERCAMHPDLCPLAERLLLHFHSVPQAAAASACGEQQSGAPRPFLAPGKSCGKPRKCASPYGVKGCGAHHRSGSRRPCESFSPQGCIC